jgi:hypothetical protein
LRVLGWRLRRRQFDVLAVLKGFGPRTKALIRRIHARQVLVNQPEFAALATHVLPPKRVDEQLVLCSWRIAKQVEPTLAVGCAPGRGVEA